MTMPYCGPAPEPSSLHAAWNLDPVLLVVLAASAWLLRRQPAQPQIGTLLLAIAYVSPLCALSAGLFSARSVHHLLVVYGAAPLLAGLIRARAIPLVPAFLLHLAVFWLWHVPAAYGWALSSDAAYWLGQMALLGSSMLLWRALSDSGVSALGAFFVLLAMVMQMGLLGALITFAPQALYAPHFLTTQQFGVSPLEDQQLAGLLMWVGSLPLTLAAAGWAVLVRHFAVLQRRATA